ncbi:hypothetical protein TKK_0012472 [Trichogramma kaykai]
MYNRDVQTQFSCIKPCGVSAEKRVPGEIVRQTEPSTFIVKSNSGAMHKRHVDQLVKPPPQRSPRLMIKNEGKL